MLCMGHLNPPLSISQNCHKQKLWSLSKPVHSVVLPHMLLCSRSSHIRSARSSARCSCVQGAWSSVRCSSRCDAEHMVLPQCDAPASPHVKRARPLCGHSWRMCQKNCSNFHTRWQSTPIRPQPLPRHQDLVLSPKTSSPMLRESAVKSSLPGSVLLQARYSHAPCLEAAGGLLQRSSASLHFPLVCQRGKKNVQCKIPTHSQLLFNRIFLFEFVWLTLALSCPALL